MVDLLTCRSSPLLGLCVWQPAPNEMTHKYLDLHHSSSVTPQNCQKLPFNKSRPPLQRVLHERRKDYSLDDERRVRECNSFDKRRLNIGKKETLSPSPSVITVSMKSFPIIPLKTQLQYMNYPLFHYEKYHVCILSIQNMRVFV